MFCVDTVVYKSRKQIQPDEYLSFNYSILYFCLCSARIAHDCGTTKA